MRRGETDRRTRQRNVGRNTRDEFRVILERPPRTDVLEGGRDRAAEIVLFDYLGEFGALAGSRSSGRSDEAMKNAAL
jgi:hypothetical protein